MSKSHNISEQQLIQLYSEACGYHEQGDLERAKICYLSLLHQLGEAPVILYNLGLVWYEQMNYQEAKNCFSRAVKADPEDIDSWFNLALSQKKCGDLQGAIESNLTLLKRVPHHADAHYNLSLCYQEAHRYDEAITSYQNTVTLDEDHLSAHNNLAYLYHRQGQKKMAEKHYQQVLRIDPEHESAAHMLAAIAQRDVGKAPDEYVTAVFDEYSIRFEKSLLEDLQYRGPALLRQLVEDTLGKKYLLGTCLDLGCGTGLVADSLSGMFTAIDGVDLSAGMLAIARKKDVYNHLEQNDIISFLKEVQKGSKQYDCVIAMDVFVYLGDLREVFYLVGNISKKNKQNNRHVHFLFSTETMQQSVEPQTISDPSEYQLQLSGRFCHSSSYIHDLTKEHGWEICAEETVKLRKEGSEWLHGSLWLLRM